MHVPLYLWALIAIAFLAIVAGAIALKAFSRRVGESYPYKKRRSLFTESEISFLQTLEQAAGEDCRVYAKVRADDVLSVRPLPDRKEWLGAWNRLRGKHFDFLLCDPGSFAPVAAVELDDGSQDDPHRSVRDDFLERACMAAGLPLVRIPKENRHSVSGVRQQILEDLDELDVDQPVADSPGEEGRETDSTPVCPKCSSVMVRRRINKGPRTGRMYWSCSRFPRCLGALPINNS
ncbi:MAG: DUF2726 domain-containing protein [Desulfohalobiaceae bacterium]|nr:DUF2726 domain-containing protein [Desulfohalobiaceae bacterium]